LARVWGEATAAVGVWWWWTGSGGREQKRIREGEARSAIPRCENRKISEGQIGKKRNPRGARRPKHFPLRFQGEDEWARELGSAFGALQKEEWAHLADQDWLDDGRDVIGPGFSSPNHGPHLLQTSPFELPSVFHFACRLLPLLSSLSLSDSDYGSVKRLGNWQFVSAICKWRRRRRRRGD